MSYLDEFYDDFDIFDESAYDDILINENAYQRYLARNGQTEMNSYTKGRQTAKKIAQLRDAKSQLKDLRGHYTKDDREEKKELRQFIKAGKKIIPGEIESGKNMKAVNDAWNKEKFPEVNKKTNAARAKEIYLNKVKETSKEKKMLVAGMASLSLILSKAAKARALSKEDIEILKKKQELIAAKMKDIDSKEKTGIIDSAKSKAEMFKLTLDLKKLTKEITRRSGSTNESAFEDYLVNKTAIYEAALNGEIDEDDASELLESLDELYENDDTDVYAEGTNLEIRKILKSYLQESKGYIKNIKTLMGEGKYKEAKSELANVKKLHSMTTAEISNMESTIGSVVFGWFTAAFGNYLNYILIMLIPVFGPAIASIKKTVDGFSMIIDKIQNGGGITLDDFNMYKGVVLSRLKEVGKGYDIMEKEISRIERLEKNSDATKESTIDYLDSKIAIYEAALNGEIDEDEKNILLESLDEDYTDDYDDYEESYEDYLDSKIAIYEAALNGEIDEDEKNILLESLDEDYTDD